jgi:hypothetical protein
MYYTFKEAELFSGQHNLKVINVIFEVVEGSVDKSIKNECLNGKFTIKGVIENQCLTNESKIRAGSVWNLRIKHEGLSSVVPVLFLELMEINFLLKSPKMRQYSWFFCVVQRPINDSIGILPKLNDGEISIEELLEQIGYTRGDMEKERTHFNAEGAFR